jgi:hypothetical protein
MNAHLTGRRLASVCAALIAVPLAAVVSTGQAAAASPPATFVPCPPGGG